MQTEGAHSDISLYKEAARQSQTRPSYHGLAFHSFPEAHEAAGAALAARLPPGAKVLDLAAGSGAMCRRIKDLGFVPSACDLVPENFKLHGEVPFWVCNLNSGLPPESKGSFDAVVAMDIIEHLENPRYFLRECYAALRPGGLFLMTTPNVDSPFSKALFVRTGHFHWFDDAPYLRGGHITPIPLRLLERALKETGFEQIVTTSLVENHLSLGWWRMTALAWIISFISSDEVGQTLFVQAGRPTSG